MTESPDAITDGGLEDGPDYRRADVSDPFWLRLVLAVVGGWLTFGAIEVSGTAARWAAAVLLSTYWIWFALRLRRRIRADVDGVMVRGMIRTHHFRRTDVLAIRPVRSGEWLTYEPHLARVEVWADTAHGMKRLAAGAYLRPPKRRAIRLVEACPDPSIRNRLRERLRV